MAGELAARPPGAFAPLRTRAFALLWGAGLIANIGTWMNVTATGWLMTELAPSPLMVAAVQAASSLPVFLFAILAGALADLFDRRRLLLLIQGLTSLVAAALAITVWTGTITAPLLLLLTFLMGTGAAFLAPAWQSTVPTLVPRPLLPQAVALNAMSLNVARAIGPAVAGLLIAAFGVAVPFAADTATFVVAIVAILAWRPEPAARPAFPRETLPGAIVAGLRYAAASGAFKATLGRAGLFFAGASAFWALLPLVVRTSLDGGPGLYGLMLGAVGTGAVLGALLIPRVRAQVAPGHLLAAANLGVATAAVGVGFALSVPMALAASFLMGLAWILALTTLNLSAQLTLPDWVRGRGLSLFTTVFFGTMTLGSLGWGALAAALGLGPALAAAAGLALAGTLAGARLRLTDVAGAPDLAPSAHWPQPVAIGEAPLHPGPVMVTIRYRVPPASREAFMAAMSDLEGARRRGGATAWGLFEDAARPGELMEWFMEAGWDHHLRHHQRVTQADRALQEAVLALHDGEAPPVVRHWLRAGSRAATQAGGSADAGAR